MTLSPGMPAPLFTLFDSDKQEISLASFRRSKVLLLFFPAAFTSTCTRELCSVRDELSLYNDVNTKVIGISTDSLYALARYKAEQQLNFTLLSDFNKEASRLYDAIYETFGFNMKGVSKRAAFIIDKEGILQYTEVLENAGEVPNFEAIQKTLAGLK